MRVYIIVEFNKCNFHWTVKVVKTLFLSIIIVAAKTTKTKFKSTKHDQKIRLIY